MILVSELNAGRYSAIPIRKLKYGLYTDVIKNGISSDIHRIGMKLERSIENNTNVMNIRVALRNRI